MAGSKIHKQEIIASIYPYACFMMGAKITSNNVIESKLINRTIVTTREPARMSPTYRTQQIRQPWLIGAQLSRKASVGMYSRCDYLLFAYFLILPSLLHSSILFDCLYTCNTALQVSHQLKALCNSYIMGARDVWHLLHLSTRAINAMHPECTWYN